MTGPAHRLNGYHLGLLGTTIELIVEARSEDDALIGEQRLIEEISRLETVFTVFDEGSELSRWCRQEVIPGPELTEVLEAAIVWQERSGGAFNPLVGRLMDVWSRAAEEGSAPSEESIETLTLGVSALPYTIQDGRVTVTGPLDGLNLNAIAKGWIVDHSAASALGSVRVTGVSINAGGDLLNRTSSTLVAGIEDPSRPYDNVPPLLTVALEPGMSLATSGVARRGWQIGGTHYGHVLDPRSGHPVGRVASASVVARSAMDADVVATILTVLHPEHGMELVGGLDGLVSCVVTDDGSIHRSAGWLSLELS